MRSLTNLCFGAVLLSSLPIKFNKQYQHEFTLLKRLNIDSIQLKETSVVLRTGPPVQLVYDDHMLPKRKLSAFVYAYRYLFAHHIQFL